MVQIHAIMLINLKDHIKRSKPLYPFLKGNEIFSLKSCNKKKILYKKRKTNLCKVLQKENKVWSFQITVQLILCQDNYES